MEPLRSPVVATDGNHRQTRSAKKPQRQAKSVATGCHQLPATFHGKEGVDGSSPSEGFRKRPAYRRSLLSVTALASRWRTHFRHQLVARVPDNGLCRAPFRTRKLLDHVRVCRKHHGRHALEVRIDHERCGVTGIRCRSQTGFWNELLSAELSEPVPRREGRSPRRAPGSRSARPGSTLPARRRGGAKLTPARVRDIRKASSQSASSRVLGLLAEGLTKREVAAKLFLTYSTIHSHTRAGAS
jgi:hypothetical protein